MANMELEQAIEILKEYLAEDTETRNTIEIAIEVVLEELEKITLAAIKDIVNNWASIQER